MKHLYKKCLMGFIAAASILATSSFAEEDVPVVNVPQRPVAEPRAPIPFVPFELKDQAGNPVPPEATVELPGRDGQPPRRIRAADYLKTLNDSEQFLNKYGYTLRKPDEIPAEFYESGVDPQQVSEQVRVIDEENVEYDPSFMHKPPTGPELQDEHDAAEFRASKPSMEGLFKLSTVQSETDGAASERAALANYNDGCNPNSMRADEGCLRREAPGFDFGRRDLAFISMQTYLEMRGNETRTHVVAESGLEAGLLDMPFKVLHGLAELQGSDKEGDRIHLEATKLGQKVLSFDTKSRDGIFDDLPSSFGLTRNPENNTFPFLQEEKVIFQATVVIVIIPVTVRVGVRSEGKLKWHTPSSFTMLGLQLVPQINAAAYAQAAVGVGIEAGVDGEVTLVEDILTIAGHVKFRMSTTKGPFFEALATGNNTLTALRGTVSLYARYPCGIDADLWPPSIEITTCTPKMKLFGWNPITLSDLALFNEKFVWWLGANGVPGGAATDDAMVAKLLEQENQWEALEKDEAAFFSQLRNVLNTWSAERIQARVGLMEDNVKTAISDATALSERLRNDLQGEP